MAKYADEEAQPLTARDADEDTDDNNRRHSISSISTLSVILESVSDAANVHRKDARYPTHKFDMEEKPAWQVPKPADRRFRRGIWIIAIVAIAGWIAALFLFIASGAHKPFSSRPHDPHATFTAGNGKKVTLDQVLQGAFSPRSHGISWTSSPNGEDGLLLKRGGEDGRDYLVIEDVRYMDDTAKSKAMGKTLLKSGQLILNGNSIGISDAWPSSDHKNVLVQTERVKNWRHSSTARYWLVNVESQKAQSLDPRNMDGRMQLATWSPTGDAVAFTRDNNLYVHELGQKSVRQITKDGGPNYFYGIPDWVYEEEVFGGAVGTWWSDDGKYIAFLRTNETDVPTYPVDYFFSRPSGQQPRPGEEAYPDTQHIKYPKAGAPMSVVSLLIYDVANDKTFEVKTDDDFPDDDRLITEVVWAGKTGKVIVKETNRESDVEKVILMDATTQKGRIVRETDVKKIDGGWFEISQDTTFVPADPENGRPYDGYIDTVIYEGFDHLAYFTPLNSSEPKMLTSGKWEVVSAPTALDLKNNIVYFKSTQESSIQRHIYSVKLDGTGHAPLTDTSNIGYYDMSFSSDCGYALVSYQGPGIPWQKVIATPTNKDHVEISVEDNSQLRELAASSELPLEVYSTINVDGFELNVLERRPPHFNPKRKYPVLFAMYGGPGSQSVSRKFGISFESYIASSLEYIILTVDGRGTGYLGRDYRTVIRKNLGYYEAHDQIAAAKIWAAKPYVDASRIAIWGWSFGGYLTLKALEADAGETFRYGMAVAPVTDWRFYDSVYTERYMLTPQHNAGGYDNASVHDADALGKNVRFLVMHGASDDNVHTQNTLALLDKLDLRGIRNYDVHFFPDSDHGIYFHGARGVVYHKLSDWLVNAFNGEWLRTENPKPLADLDAPMKRST